MTTNQTIDGVSRELLVRLQIALSNSYCPEGFLLNELRALLDAPAVQWLAMEVNGKPWVIKEWPNAEKWRAMGYELFPVEPAAQPQGEPVAYMAKRKNPTGNARLDRPLLSLVGEDGWGPAFECVPLYAEQPAPANTLKAVLTSLKEACESGVIIDTLWLTGPCSETLFDYLERMIETEQPAPVAVVLPKRRDFSPQSDSEWGWNACLDEVARLTATVRIPEPLVMTDGLHTYEYVTGHNAAIDKMLGVKS